MSSHVLFLAGLVLASMVFAKLEIQINPAFGIGRFRKEHVWWHAPTWWWFMPRDYWLCTPASMAMYGISCMLR